MEFAKDGTLLDLLNENGSFDEEQARIIFRQIIEGVAYAHIRGFIHRDIKLENIFLHEGQVKIGDWGFACVVTNRLQHASVGTLDYCSPEIVNGRPYRGPEVDVWSVSVCNV